MAGFVKVMGYTAEDLEAAYQRGKSEGTVTYESINFSDLVFHTASANPNNTKMGQGRYVDGNREVIYNTGVVQTQRGWNSYGKVLFCAQSDITKNNKTLGYGIVAYSGSKVYHLTKWGNSVDTVLDGSSDNDPTPQSPISNATIRKDLLISNRSVISDPADLGIKAMNSGKFYVPKDVYIGIVAYGDENGQVIEMSFKILEIKTS